VASKVQKGNYYRNRTKAWLESLGYTVANLERKQRIQIPDKDGGPDKIFFRTSDIWGSDLIARNEERMVFIQVKSNPVHIAQGMREINKGPWPPTVERWVVYWPPRRRSKDGPDIVEVGKQEEEEPLL
jgi:hypothetical protein